MPAPAVIAAAIPAIADLIKTYITRNVKDKDLADKIHQEIVVDLVEHGGKELESATQIIVAEAQSASWLTRSWRPICMLTFTALIVMRWIGLTVDIPVEIEKELWQVVKIGIGGYVIGRSAEKVAEKWNHG